MTIKSRKFIISMILSLTIVGAVSTPSFGEGYISPIDNEYKFVSPSDIVFQKDGSILAVDNKNHNIALLKDLKGSIYAGYTVKGVYGDFEGAYIDSTYEKSFFKNPYAIVSYRNGYAVSDSNNNAVRFVGEGKVQSLVGSQTEENEGVHANDINLNNPLGLAYDIERDHLYIADSGNGRICRVDSKGKVMIYASGFVEPVGLCFYKDVLYVTDAGSHQIFAVRNGKQSLVAGNNYKEVDVLVGGFLDGEASKSMFSSPQGIEVVDQKIYISDTGNSAIRVINKNMVSTLAFCDASKNDIFPGRPIGIEAYNSKLYVADEFNAKIFQVEKNKVFFEDVLVDDWFAPYVSYVKVNGIMQGSKSREFLPLNNFTKAELVTILYNNAGRPSQEKNPVAFQDISDEDYYKDAAKWAVEAGIIKSEQKFEGYKAVSREEVIYSLYSYSKYKGEPIIGGNTLSSFKDASSVNSDYKSAFEWAVENKIVIGKDGLLQPKALITRAEIATMLMSMFE